MKNYCGSQRTSSIRLMDELTGASDAKIAALAVDRWSFTTTSGRKPGEEDLSSFRRKGIAGDWTNYFSREAGEVFDSFAGDALVELGYADDRNWYESL